MTTLRFHPGPMVGAIGLPDVVVTFPFAKPALLEQRTDNVASVPDDVQHSRLRIGAHRSADDKAQLRSLLDWPQVTHETESPNALERRAQLGRGLVLRKRSPALDAHLHGPHLAEVDESRLRTHGAGEERRSGARRAHNEDDPLCRERGIAAAFAEAALGDAGDRPPIEPRLPKGMPCRHSTEDYKRLDHSFERRRR